MGASASQLATRTWVYDGHVVHLQHNLVTQDYAIRVDEGCVLWRRPPASRPRSRVRIADAIAAEFASRGRQAPPRHLFECVARWKPPRLVLPLPHSLAS